MRLSRLYAQKIIDYINNSQEDVLLCEDLANELGIKDEVFFEWIEEFYPMIKIDIDFNMRDLLEDLESYVEYLDKYGDSYFDVSFDPEEDKYQDFIDYVYKNMTIDGGVLNTNYKLNERDKRILKKLIDKK